MHIIEDTSFRILRVEAAKTPFVLDIEWSDGEKSRVDMTGLVHSSRHFKMFANDAEAFRAVKPVHYGTGIGWKNGLDYAAATLKTLADEQRPLKGKHLAAFERKYQLNTAETAALLKIAERTVRSYRKATALPEPVAISLRALDSDPTVFAAHYRPIARERGRPKKSPS